MHLYNYNLEYSAQVCDILSRVPVYGKQWKLDMSHDNLKLKRWIKPHLASAGIIRSSPYSPR